MYSSYTGFTLFQMDVDFGQVFGKALHITFTELSVVQISYIGETIAFMRCFVIQKLRCPIIVHTGIFLKIRNWKVESALSQLQTLINQEKTQGTPN